MLRRRARREARKEGVSEERSQAKQTNSLRARGPRGKGKISIFKERHPFNDKQSQIAERKTVGEQGPGDRGKKNQ